MPGSDVQTESAKGRASRAEEQTRGRLKLYVDSRELSSKLCAREKLACEQGGDSMSAKHARVVPIAKHKRRRKNQGKKETRKEREVKETRIPKMEVEVCGVKKETG